jgi:hypothetical protein
MASMARRSDTTLTKVSLFPGDADSQQVAAELLAAFQTNRTVVDLEISGLASFCDETMTAYLSIDNWIGNFNGCILQSVICARMTSMHSNRCFKRIER